MDTPSFAATTGRGCGPSRRRSRSHCGRVGLQRVQLVARDDTLLELGGGGLEVHTQLLRRGRGLHRLGGLVRRHAVKGSERVRRLRPRRGSLAG